MMSRLSFDVFGMSCAACSARVENAVSKLDSVVECQVNLLANSMTVEGDVSVESVINAVEKAGYSAKEKCAKSAEKENNSLQNKDKNDLVKGLVASVVLMIFLMYLSMGHAMMGTPLPLWLDGNPLAIAIAFIA